MKKVHSTVMMLAMMVAGFIDDKNGKADVFANAIKHDFKSKNPTTRWSDIIRLK